MGDPAAGRVRRRPAKRLRIDVLVGDRLHDIGPGHEHVARAFDHDREVGDGRRVHRSPGARTHHDRELRHDARGQGVAEEDVGVAAQRDHALLDPRPAGVVQPDDRRADLHRQVHDLADLRGVRLGQRSTEDREVLAEDEDQATVDGPVPGDHAIAEERGLDLGIAIRDERVELDERSGVEQQLQSFTRRQFSARMLLVDALLPAAQQRLRAHRVEPRRSFLICRQGRSSAAATRVFVQGQWPSYGPSYPPKW